MFEDGAINAYLDSCNLLLRLSLAYNDLQPSDQPRPLPQLSFFQVQGIEDNRRIVAAKMRPTRSRLSGHHIKHPFRPCTESVTCLLLDDEGNLFDVEATARHGLDDDPDNVEPSSSTTNNQRASRRILLQSTNGFVVDDAFADPSLLSEDTASSQLLDAFQTFENRRYTLTDGSDTALLRHGWFANDLARGIERASAEIPSERADIVALLEDALGAQSGEDAARLLSSFPSDTMFPRNIDDAHEDLLTRVDSRLQEASHGDDQPRITSIPIQSLLAGRNEASQANLLDIYRSLLNTWIRHLPTSSDNTIPMTKLRIAKEVIARQVAMSLALSSIRINKPSPAAGKDAMLIDDESRSRPRSSLREPSSPAMRSSPPLPASSQPALPGSSQASHPFQDDSSISEAAARLRQYANMRDPGPAHGAANSIISRLAETWNPLRGDDAADTDASQIGSLMLGIEGSRMDEDTRRRQLRRLEKRRQFEARQSQSQSQSQGLASKRLRTARRSGAGFGGPASSPGVGGASWKTEGPHTEERGRATFAAPSNNAAAASSQTQGAPSSQFGGLGVVASQIEPGRHGGRPATELPMRKKGPRKKGF